MSLAASQRTLSAGRHELDLTLGLSALNLLAGVGGFGLGHSRQANGKLDKRVLELEQPVGAALGDLVCGSVLDGDYAGEPEEPVGLGVVVDGAASGWRVSSANRSRI